MRVDPITLAADADTRLLQAHTSVVAGDVLVPGVVQRRLLARLGDSRIGLVELRLGAVQGPLLRPLGALVLVGDRVRVLRLETSDSCCS